MTVRGTLLALWKTVALVASFATNPIVVLIVVLALFYNTHAVSL